MLKIGLIGGMLGEQVYEVPIVDGWIEYRSDIIIQIIVIFI